MTMAHPSKSLKSKLDLGQLVEEHQVGLWRYLRSLGCESSEAEDLVQETFLAVIQKPFDNYAPAATAAYLRKVAFNRFISGRRRAGRMIVTSHVEEIDKTWTRWAGHDQGDGALDALRECLGSLTDRARSALQMRFQKQSSRSEIAGALGISEHGAKNLMQRAKKQLRECVERKSK